MDFGLGQIHLARAIVVGGDWMAQAETEFKEVVQAYEAGNTRIKDLAGHAQARLGAIALLEGNAGGAIEHYTRATELVSPYFQAYYCTRLGEIHAVAGDLDLAIKAYTEALSTAEFYGDGESATKYAARLNELRAGE